MTLPANPAPSILSNAEWRRLSPAAQKYVIASFELLGTANGHLNDGDFRQASEMAWGAAAQMVKAIAENWSLPHGSHRDLQGLMDSLAPTDSQSALHEGFDVAQDLHHNFYENDADKFFVTLAVQRMAYFIEDMLPWLRRSRQPRASTPEQDL